MPDRYTFHNYDTHGVVVDTQTGEATRYDLVRDAEAEARRLNAMENEQETDGQMLARLGTNGAKWGAEFNAVAQRLGYIEMDEGWLIGWFANAIEQGRTAGRAERITEIEQEASDGT